jgi:four helix bundle protein
MKEYKKLIVWQKSIELVKLVYAISKELPRSEEYGLSSQIKRAAVSIAANIAEANGRNSNGERKQFLGIALGSAYELETELIIIVELKLAEEELVKPAIDLLDEVQKMTATLIRNIKPAVTFASKPLISSL